MFRWIRKLDDLFFSPPHKFETIFKLIALQLRLEFQENGIDQEVAAKEKLDLKPR